MAATVIGAYVHNGAGWQRANAGSPTGRAGVFVRAPSQWDPCSNTYGKVSTTWYRTWTTIDGEIALTGLTKTATDTSSPYGSYNQINFESDGDFGWRSYNNNSGAPGYTYVSGQWRPYDCGRSYEMKWVENSSNGSGVFTRSPALAENTWSSLGTTRDYFWSVEGFTALPSRINFTVYIRETVSAPAGGDISATFDFGGFNNNL